MRRTDFSDQLRKVMILYKHIGCNLNVMRQYACIVINPITVDNCVAFFNSTSVDRASDPMMTSIKAIHFKCLDRSSFVCLLVHWGSTDDLLLLYISIGVVWQTRYSHLSTRCIPWDGCRPPAPGGI